MNRKTIESETTQSMGNKIRFSQRLKNLKGSLIREMLSNTENVEMIALAGGLPDDEFLCAIELPSVDTRLLQYGTSEGEREFRKVIADTLRLLGINTNENGVLVTHGSQQGLDLVAKLFIDEGTPVLTESPTYLAALQVFRFFGANFHGLSLSENGMCPDQLDWAIKRYRPRFIYLVPTFQNPSGVCYSAELRREVARVIGRNAIPLVEDDPYRMISFRDNVPDPVVSYLPEKHPWIYLGSFSKSLAPGLRIGYLSASKNLLPKIIQIKQSSDLHSNRVGQFWATRFFQREDLCLKMYELRKRYQSKRDAMCRALNKTMGEQLRYRVPEGGFFVWGELAANVMSTDLLRRTLQRGASFMPGDAFFPERCGNDRFIRLNFSNPTIPEIEKGISILATCYHAECRF